MKKSAPFAACLVLIFLSCCSTVRSTVNIPPNQAFVLGEYESGAYNARLENLSNTVVLLRLVDTESKALNSTLELAPGEVTIIIVSGTQTVYCINNTDREVQIKAKLSEGVAGMRYQPTNADQK